MPSWNIHTAHVERLLAGRSACDLGIADENIFLFGNYVPDIYLGFMVHDLTFRLDYCLTHRATPHVIPVPDADGFWDDCVAHPLRRPKTAEGMSLTLGAWAHLVADRRYNLRFREFSETCDVPTGDELRMRKQADFDLFGHSLGVTRLVRETPELVQAAYAFREYSVLPDDVARAIEVANSTTIEAARPPKQRSYQLLDARWLTETFESCDKFLAEWLAAWMQLRAEGRDGLSAEIRATMQKG